MGIKFYGPCVRIRISAANLDTDCGNILSLIKDIKSKSKFCEKQTLSEEAVKTFNMNETRLDEILQRLEE